MSVKPTPVNAVEALGLVIVKLSDVVHREIWVRPSQDTERRFTFTNADIPARTGHQVTLLLSSGGRPLALVNFSTQQYVNLVTRRQFELFGAAEAFAFAALLVGAALAGAAGLVTLIMGAARQSMAPSNGL